MRECVIINWPPIPPIGDGGDTGGGPGPVGGVY